MSNVIPFKASEAIRAFALQVIEARGASAGLDAGIAARRPGLDADTAGRLLAVAAEIERIQGYGWYFGEVGASTG